MVDAALTEIPSVLIITFIFLPLCLRIPEKFLHKGIFFSLDREISICKIEPAVFVGVCTEQIFQLKGTVLLSACDFLKKFNKLLKMKIAALMELV